MILKKFLMMYLKKWENLAKMIKDLYQQKNYSNEYHFFFENIFSASVNTFYDSNLLFQFSLKLYNI